MQTFGMKPLLTDQKTEQDTSAVLLSAGLFCGPNHILGDDAAVGIGDERLLQFVWNDLFNLIFEAQRNLCDLLCRERRAYFIGSVSRKHCVLWC